MQDPIYNPPVPFEVRIDGGFVPGKMVRIQGSTPPSADRFNINLQCGSSSDPDLAFHLSVRLLQDYIARNHYQDGSWGDEEDKGGLPIAAGQKFEVLLLCDPVHFKVAINGRHFCEFNHRMQFQRVTHLGVNGDVELSLVSFEGVAPGGGAAQSTQSAPNYSSGYGPPPNQGGYAPPPSGYGPPPSGGYGPSGPSPGQPAWQQPEGEKSGLESFLETAGSAVAGALTHRMAEQMIGNITGGGQHHQYPNYPQYNQQPSNRGPEQGSGGGFDVGHLLQDLAGSVLSGSQRQPPPRQAPAGGQGDGVLGSVGSLLQSVAGQALSGSQNQQRYQPQAPPPSQGGGGVDVGSLLSSLAEQVLTPKQTSTLHGHGSMPMPNTSFPSSFASSVQPSAPPPPQPMRTPATYPSSPMISPTHPPAAAYMHPPYSPAMGYQPPNYYPPPPASSYPPAPGYPPGGYPVSGYAAPSYPPSGGVYNPPPGGVYNRPPGGVYNPPPGGVYNPPTYPTTMPVQQDPSYPYYMPTEQRSKSSTMSKVMKYGLPIAGAGLGGYLLSEALQSDGDASCDSD